jgi:hypothetical protein
MARIQLRVYIEPGQAEVFVNVKRKDGSYDKHVGIIDTGAQTSLTPAELMAVLAYRLGEHANVNIEQTGIARQSFEAIEAYTTVFLEDQTGARTEDFEARVWFANTKRLLIGFGGILERAVLHLDMPEMSGYLDFGPS